MLMLDLRTVLIHLSPLKDVSAVHEVTGRVENSDKGFDVRVKARDSGQC